MSSTVIDYIIFFVTTLIIIGISIRLIIFVPREIQTQRNDLTPQKKIQQIKTTKIVGGSILIVGIISEIGFLLNI